MKHAYFLLLSVGLAAPASATELLVNGGFETGDYSGWTASVRPSSNGNLNISVPGTASPLSGFATAANPLGGAFYSVTDQTGPGSYALTQSFFIPVSAAAVTFSFQMFANNSTGTTIIDPIGLDHTGPANQHARVDILGIGADPFSTSLGDIIASLYLGDDGAGANPYISYSFDLLAAGLSAGNSYQVRFGQVDNQGFFQQGVDNVSILARLGAVPEPSTWAMLIFGFGMVGASMRRRQQAMRVSYS
ncbi:MAG: PEPxxWA-CTERM sorting domain-containing protein [Parasphingorhabdus sp.]|nr:PEPxxWA-CTERM sorting domain-containing protein [Parasphingorhabdus sp.]